jgi:hypothetical protein
MLFLIFVKLFPSVSVSETLLGHPAGDAGTSPETQGVGHV